MEFRRAGSTRSLGSRPRPRSHSTRISPEESLESQSGTLNDAESPPLSPQNVEHVAENDGFHPTSDANNVRPSIDYGDAESAMGIARKICQLGQQHIDERSTTAIPGYPVSAIVPPARKSAARQRVPISKILGRPLPSMDRMRELLEYYFDAVHWFSLAIYEPKFRRKFDSLADGFANPSQKPFLVLLATMLGMSSWYRSQRSGIDSGEQKEEWKKLSSGLLSLAETHVLELMDHHSITAAQAFILLGSHNVYHGRPNLAFSLLGATIKISQALGLHREPLRGEVEDIEERKRVWWTIYTWDRFASITYGRPLGINDKDCNVSMPLDVLENPSFVSTETESQSICYSAYQRELNELYLIASPALEPVFGSRASSEKHWSGDMYVSLIKTVTSQLHRWRHRLPRHLVLDLEKDFSPGGTLSSRAHVLQALALQLTFDNLCVVLHRPFLAQQVDHLSATQDTPSDHAGESTPINVNNTSSSEQDLRSKALSSRLNSDPWWSAAVRTARVTDLPILAQLATDSHLVAFLAINLFNAAIVLSIIAISDPLSDTAQVMKRTITRIFRLQDLLGKRSTLSKQSTSVLKNVINMLLTRESQAMLAPVTGPEPDMSDQIVPAPECSLMSVEDTLRLPLDVASGPFDTLEGSSIQHNPNRSTRLNEGLSSFQNVFAPANDRSSYGIPQENRLERTDSGNLNEDPYYAWQMPAQQDWNEPDFSQAGLEETYFDSGESGLYWLWDMTWNAPET
ncbi:hypothetical protein AWENTII_006717 [Aspergillus wentii]